VIKVAQLRWGEKIGGVERVLRCIASYIDREQFDVRFFFLGQGGPYENEMRKKGFHVTVIPARSGYDLHMRVDLLREMRAYHPDIIHDHGIPPFIRPILGFMTSSHLLSFEHGEIEINRQKHKPWLNWLKGWEYFFFCKRVLVNSIANKEMLEQNNKRCAKKIDVIPLGIDMKSFNVDRSIERDSTYEGLVLGYVGRLQSYDKGIDFIPQLAHQLRSHGFFDFKILVIGDGPDRDALNELSSELNVDEHIVCLGYRDDVAELMGEMDIVVIPSRSEAFGLIGIEALAAGARVVAFSVEGLKETLADCPGARLVPPGDIKEMTDAVLQIWKKVGKKRYSEGLNYVKDRFDAKRMVRDLEAIYCDVMDVN
jgi:glycosyltransferase involved in cell wall biosynthesis